MLHVSIPELHSYRPTSGIGRVLYGLLGALGDRAVTHDVSYRSVSLPIVRNFPRGIYGAPEETDLVLFPKLIGAGALYNHFPYKSIVMFHDMGVIDCREDFQSHDRFSRFVIRKEVAHLEHANRIIVPSEFTKTRLIAYSPVLASKITVANPAVADDYFKVHVDKAEARNCLSEQIGHPLSGPLLLYVGSELPRKNVNFLMQVVRKLKQSHPDISLLKVGDAGSELFRKESLRCAESLGLTVGSDVIFVDSIDDEMLMHSYMAADCYVSGSLYEGFGLPCIEALALGLPVVALRTGILDNCMPGVEISLRKPEDFSAKVDMVLNQGLDDRDAIRRYIQNRFSWARYAGAFLGTVETMMGGGQDAYITSARRG